MKVNNEGPSVRVEQICLRPVLSYSNRLRPSPPHTFEHYLSLGLILPWIPEEPTSRLEPLTYSHYELAVIRST
jgi:hypothetical protein